jgi:hypothetical protein
MPPVLLFRLVTSVFGSGVLKFGFEFQTKKNYLLTIFNKISFERGPKGQWVPGRLSPQGPLSKEIVFVPQIFLSNLRVCVLFLCLHTTLPQNAPLPKCARSGLASYNPCVLIEKHWLNTLIFPPCYQNHKTCKVQGFKGNELTL